MRRKRRNHTSNFKAKVAVAALKGDRTVAELAEQTVGQMMQKFGVSCHAHVVYYWIERGIVGARQIKCGTPYWISLDAAKEQALVEWVKNSSRISTGCNS